MRYIDSIMTVFVLALLVASVWLGGYTMYQINTTDIHGIVKQLVIKQ